MLFRASHNHCRMSPSKVRPVVNLIRGQSYNQASRILAGMSQRSAKAVRKVLDSAMANASHAIDNKGLDLDVDELKVVDARVNEGSRIKRWRPMSRGMAYPILKRFCHIHIGLDAAGGGSGHDIQDHGREQEQPASQGSSKEQAAAEPALSGSKE